ncbi:TPA: hypothetical protein ACGPMP_002030 [Enterobacter roggenkampii]|uniref:hypothetical protein n=1 Tax=Enterobacter roggenkampii TaxID=1812935 RepID=UPI0021C77B7D|nr:hypothetical protein [Enterobacter roggenkampii]MCU2348193.1 hypothetical protein [Enterobacter roggenkampii]MEB6619593.1 hypothetical protein [Enterobacter roggenkampii]
MMIKGWLPNLLPSLLIGSMVGVAATWQVENSLERRLDGAILSSEIERQRLINDISDASANKLEKRLQQLQENELRGERVFSLEINNPIFSSECATDDYIRLFNETSEAAERALSGESDAGMPGGAAETKR